MVCINDHISIFVDFVPVLSTNSPDDALALLLAMYTIFELSFDKKSRAIRLLYCVLHGDKNYLTNSIRSLINEKDIDLDWAKKKQSSSSSSSSTSQSNDSTTIVTEPEVQSQMNLNSSSESTVEETSPLVSQISEAKVSNDALSLNPDMSVDAHE